MRERPAATALKIKGTAKTRRFRDSHVYYCQAIEVLSEEPNRTPDVVAAHSTLFSNRAQVAFHMGAVQRHHATTSWHGCAWM